MNTSEISFLYSKPKWVELGLLGLLLVLLVGTARAELRIEITQGAAQTIPIAVVPYGGDSAGADAIHAVIGADLGRSGQFRLVPDDQMVSRPTEATQVDFRDWQLVMAQYVTIGRVLPGLDGKADVEFELFNVATGQRMTGARFAGVAPANRRRLAHHIADLIYEAITGVRGVFSTRVTYVTQVGNNYELQVADADGHNPVTVLRTQEPVLSPAWSADGRFVAYATYSNRRAAIFRQDVSTGVRQLVSSFPGLNGAPAFSPDGHRIAMVLSKDGNPDIYVMDLAGGPPRRLSQHYAIDTEPTWSPDGRYIYFTSDRSGGPQIYRVPSTGGAEMRVTFEGNYNTRARVSPDGRKLAMVHGAAGRGYRIAVLDIASRRLDVLTDGPLDESPSFAPNGQIIIYTTKSGGAEALATVSVDGNVRQRLGISQAKVREPGWSPFGSAP
ncbi:MAG: Tol-Pal system beta propeller repeat protein TolB [Immundisolibacter sp.]|uniref:Tol-Pal system beta propeller repeat protein TolB n=1 Tax=Immundisolibacter sp. TaxID=1934948 RepID=UPI003EE2ED05